MEGIKTLKDFDVKGKRVLVRVDLNVPRVHGKIVDTARVERIIPTVKYLIGKQAKVILISHFGRPKGKFNLEMSLAPIVDCLNEFLPEKVKAKFAVDCIGLEAKKSVDSLENGEVILLENLRFYEEEEKNDDDFTKKIASLGDIYINDAFSCSHRSHASIVGLNKYLPSGMGLLFQEEVENIAKHLTSPNTPIMAIVGGSKVSSKLGLLHSLIKKTDAIVIGGGMANTFLKAIGTEIGNSLCEKDLVATAKKIIEDAKTHNCKIILPIDAVVASQIDNPNDCEVVNISDVPVDKMILDIGPLSCSEIISQLHEYKTVIWNGPLGAFEFRPFNVGTETIARMVASYTRSGNLSSVAGGGDVVASLTSGGLKETFSYLSTAGGAFLEWLEGKEIPGVAVLKT
jgi:phosphoglycerate kinase